MLSVPLTVGVGVALNVPPVVPPAQVLPLTVALSRMPNAELYVTVEGSGSLSPRPDAVAAPAPLATARQYSTTAPGMALGLVVPLIGSLMIVLNLLTVSAAAATV